MARKGQVSIQDSIETDEEFENYLQTNFKKLICMEVYSEFCGPCLATAHAVRRGKLEIGQENVAMVKALSDHIRVLSRFKDKSEPVFLFISKGKLTRALFGANGIELCRILEEELGLTLKELETGVARPKQDISEQLPEEYARIEDELRIEAEIRANEERVRVVTLAARKKRVAERIARMIPHLNFIIFWPHNHKAYYDLYENWDLLNIQVAAKEEMQLTEEMIPEVLYMSDVEPNEACVHALTAGPALVILFKMLDNDSRNFVRLLRHAIYEMIPTPKEDEPPEKQLPPIPAYQRYATVSKQPREVRRDRYNAHLQRLKDEEEDRQRLASEQARLAREAEEERRGLQQQRRDEERMARLAAGLPASPEPEPATEEQDGVEGEGGEGLEAGDTEKTETDSEPTETEHTEKPVEDEFHSDVAIEGEEYIPPGGLFVPGLYTPPNDLAKANALKLLFPKDVAAHARMESEHLPPHVLVLFTADKRKDVKEIIDQYRDEILHLGIFTQTGDDLHSLEHVAYSIKQYEGMDRHFIKHKDRLAVMVSRQRSLPLLQLSGLNPYYISIDHSTGVKDCLTLFPVGYGDDFEEIPSLVEEEEAEPDVPEPGASSVHQETAEPGTENEEN